MINSLHKPTLGVYPYMMSGIFFSTHLREYGIAGYHLESRVNGLYLELDQSTERWSSHGNISIGLVT